MTTNVVEKMLERAGFRGVGAKSRKRLVDAISEVYIEELTALEDMRIDFLKEIDGKEEAFLAMVEQRNKDFTAMTAMQKDLFDKYTEAEKKVLAEEKKLFELRQRETNSKLALIYKLCGEVFGEQTPPAVVTAEEPVQLVRNFYKCPCGYDWEDIHSCACDDRCPVCNTAVSPYYSEDLEKCAH